MDVSYAFEDDSDPEEALVFKPAMKKSKLTAKNLFDVDAENISKKPYLENDSFFHKNLAKTPSKLETISELETTPLKSEGIIPSKLSRICEKSPIKLINRKNKVAECTSEDPTCCEQESIPKKKFRAPKIYFGTRTHKQIAQVIKELSRISCSSDIRICTLASRKYTCIHPASNYYPNMNKTEFCQQLLDPYSGSGCKFKANAQRINGHDSLDSYRFPEIWDIEDLVNFGNRHSICPYFTTRSLVTTADIVFCPYSYLIDPLIRKSMNIRLNGEIIIIDEAHNIEDTCRESASLSLNQPDIIKAIRDCEQVSNERDGTSLSSALRGITRFLKAMDNWINVNSDLVKNSDYNEGVLTFTGYEAIESFENYDFGSSSFKQYQENLDIVYSDKVADGAAEEDKADQTNITGATKMVLEGLLLVLGFLYNSSFTDDYHIALMKVLVPGANPYSTQSQEDSGGWFKIRKKPVKQESHWRCTINFWCLNPATVFTDIKEKARCVILTSGTLSPIDSFQSELGAQFPIRLEANHVIDKKQCWVGSLGTGPNNVSLNAVFTNTCTYGFQDELGQLVLKVCSFVPHGVLLFLSSYHLLDKLYDRWKSTGILGEILEHKKVLCEPRRTDDFDALMKDFYQFIEQSSNAVIGSEVTGVLFLAVCRGKVSEGLDFADNNARIVITVGIPFPNVKDSQVTLKRSYNDKYKPLKGLLSGHQWYQIQAFRALNQALGRCIRHRNDWGAILLVDGRFTNQSYCSSLSKWIRNKIQHHHSWSSMVQNLESFIQYQLSTDELVK